METESSVGITELQIRLIIVELAAVLAPGFRSPIEEATIRAYGHYLRNIPAAILQAAVDSWIGQSRFFPAISQLLDSVDAVTGGDERMTAADSWGLIREQMFKSGAYNPPEFDQVTERTVKAMGGWRYLCLSEDTTADRARYIDAYEAIDEGEKRIARGELVAGRLQLQLSPAHDSAKLRLVPGEGDDG